MNCFSLALLYAAAAAPLGRGRGRSAAGDLSFEEAGAAGPLAAAHVRDKPRSRIIGGEDAPEGKYPYMVLLGPGDGYPNIPGGYPYVCGGALIDPLWVLTAAHCVEAGVSPKAVKIGTYDKTDFPDPIDAAPYPAYTPELADVAETILHPGWDSLYNDIALMRLKTPSSLPVVAIAETPPHLNESTTVIGWGNMEPFGNQASVTPNVLQSVEVKVRENVECRTSIKKGYEICAGDIDEGPEGQDSCHGDSGGPLFNADGDHVGIVSRGRWIDNKLCAATPGVYTDSTAYKGWIDTCLEFGGSTQHDGSFSQCRGHDAYNQEFEADPECSHVLTMELVTDSYGFETFWNLEHVETCTLSWTCNLHTGSYADNFHYVDSNTVVVSEGICAGELYRFTLHDKHGDGICCEYGAGSYKLFLDGEPIAEGGEFGIDAITLIQVPAAPTAQPTAQPAAAGGGRNGEEDSAEPSAEPTPRPTSSCFEGSDCCDSSKWYRANKPSKNCDWVSKDPVLRCKKRSASNVKANEECLNACGYCAQNKASCVGECCDSESWAKSVKVKGPSHGKKGCKWVQLKQAKRCKIYEAMENCPATCDRCGAKCDQRAGADGSCCDDETWTKASKSFQNCHWVAANTGIRCSKTSNLDGRLASVACPVTCKDETTTCASE
mmetsp:Transcript_15950/g.47912  ORF Transcript_15950/g.47912 Transcript_15950/m.47912 type:complete len:662 (-) Transcript_15950:114-2099(-)